MIAINLLNWREKLRVIQNTRLYVVAGTVAVICMILTLIVYGFVGRLIAAQQSDIVYLSEQMKGVEEKIKELNDLETQKKLLLERQKVVESLQDSRPFVVRLFDGVVRIIPDGIVLDELSRKGNELSLKGTSDSNATIAKMMSNVQALKWVQEANLGELKSTKADKSTAAQPTAQQGSSATNQTGAVSPDDKSDTSRIGFELKITLDAKQVGG